MATLILKGNIVGGRGSDMSEDIKYNNTDTGLSSTNVQNAITEVNSKLSNKVDNTDSRLTDARPASDVKDWAKAENKPTYTASEVGALADTTTHLSGDIATSEKGANNGVATLGSDGKIPSSQLPSYVDDVLEYNNKSSFPSTGESGKIYIDTSTNITYRWSGSSYTAIGSDLALGETSSTAYAGDKGKAVTDAFNTHSADTTSHITSTERSTWNAKGSYSKPSGGIPKTDLASSVQTSLGLADSALQSHQDISGKQDKSTAVTHTASTAVGSATQPVYINSSGVATATTYSLGKSVPSNAVFTDTTYSSKSAASGGTDVSLVTTGEKYTWNNKASTSVATTSANGLMSSTDKSKLDGIASGANAYSLPTASSSTLGGIKVGNDLQISSGVLSQKVKELTRAQYDALTTKDANTTYYITDSSVASADSISYNNSNVSTALNTLNYNLAKKPNYANAVDISSFPYTAPSDGLVVVCVTTTTSSTTFNRLSVNNVDVAGVSGSSAYPTIVNAWVSKDDVIKSTMYGGSYNSKKFIPIE